MHSLQLACNTCNRAKWAQWRKLQIDNNEKERKRRRKRKGKRQNKTKQTKCKQNDKLAKKKKKAVTEATETWNTAGTTAGPVWWSWPVRSRAKLMSINWPAPGWSVPRGGGEELWWQRIGGTRNTAKTLIAAGNSLAGQGGQSRTAVERTPLGHYIRCLGNRASCRGRGSWRDWRLQSAHRQSALRPINSTINRQSGQH